MALPNEQPSVRNERRRRDKPRRWRIPPALFRDPVEPEAFEGVSILSEIPDNLGLLLYQVFRDLHLWSLAPTDYRSRLFSESAGMRRDALIISASPDPDLRQEVEALTSVLRCESHAQATPLVEAALRVSSWAAGRSAGGTAILFAQAAYAVDPASAISALAVGRIAAGRGRFSMAETWLRRAIALGRRKLDWRTYCEALLELGRIYAGPTGLADPVLAHAAMSSAVRIARRHGFRLAGAQARHHLAVLELAAGRPEEAERHATISYKLFRRDSDALVVLHVLAESILAQGGSPTRAIEILTQVLPHRHSTSDRFKTLLLLLRAAGHARMKDVLESAWEDALDAVDRLGDGREAARYLLELAKAALDALERQRAAEVACRALRIATEHGDGDLIKEIGNLSDTRHLRSPHAPTEYAEHIS
jgi:tetratricopeptide (TPR) repeat protein